MLAMTQTVLPIPAPVVLFTRDGVAAPGRVQYNDAGKPFCVVLGPCTRCGGAGGFKGWPGFDCYRCGNRGSRTHERREVRLYTQAELDKLNATKAKRDAKLAAKAEAARVAAEAEQATKRAAFDAQYGDLIKAVSPLRETSAFVADVLAKAEKNLFLTDGQADALRNIVNREAAKAAQAATSNFVGTVGERRMFTATITKVIAITMTAGWQTIRGDMYLMTDADGNVLKYSTSTVDLGGEGETVTFKATVKDHAEYKGVKQTVVTRAKVEA